MSKVHKFELNRSLDSTELLKGLFVLIGAVIVFCTITTALRDVEVKEIQLSLAQELPKLIPNFRNNYTNQLSENGKEITVRAVLRNQSNLSSYLYTPTVQIFDKNDTEVTNAVISSDIKQLSGFLSPNSEYRVTYKVALKNSLVVDRHKIRILLKTDMPDSLKVVYRDLYSDIPDADWGSVESSWSVDYVYKEKLYPYKKNPIWLNWWENPR